MPSVTDTKLRAAIDETLAPRLAEHQAYIAYASEYPFKLENAHLLYAHDQYHREYLDFSSATLPLGHSRDFIRSRVSEQLNHYDRIGPPTEFVQRWPVEYAKALVSTLPNKSSTPLQVLYCSDGESALDAAQIIAMLNNQLPFLTLSYTTKEGDPFHPDEIADDVEETRNDGGLIISDETKLGFGRTGRLWAQERWNVTPDITVIGDAGGGGFPFGAVVAPPSCFAAVGMTPSPSAGHPAICAAGYETLSRIDAPLLMHVDQSAPVFHEALQGLVDQFPRFLTGVTGVGLNQYLGFASKIDAWCFYERARDVGMILSPPQGSSAVELTPALVTSELELRRGVDLLTNVLLDWDNPASD